jgi:hypothetical protein
VLHTSLSQATQRFRSNSLLSPLVVNVVYLAGFSQNLLDLYTSKTDRIRQHAGAAEVFCHDEGLQITMRCVHWASQKWASAECNVRYNDLQELIDYAAKKVCCRPTAVDGVSTGLDDGRIPNLRSVRAHSRTGYNRVGGGGGGIATRNGSSRNPLSHDSFFSRRTCAGLRNRCVRGQFFLSDSKPCGRTKVDVEAAVRAYRASDDYVQIRSQAGLLADSWGEGVGAGRDYMDAYDECEVIALVAQAEALDLSSTEEATVAGVAAAVAGGSASSTAVGEPLSAEQRAAIGAKCVKSLEAALVLANINSDDSAAETAQERRTRVEQTLANARRAQVALDANVAVRLLSHEVEHIPAVLSMQIVYAMELMELDEFVHSAKNLATSYEVHRSWASYRETSKDRVQLLVSVVNPNLNSPPPKYFCSCGPTCKRAI